MAKIIFSVIKLYLRRRRDGMRGFIFAITTYLALFVVNPGIARSTTWPGVVPVSSEYTDEATGKIQRVNGTSTIVFDPARNKHYLFNVSHVVKGKKIQFLDNGYQRGEENLGRMISDNDIDITAYEVEAPYTPTPFVVKGGAIVFDPSRARSTMESFDPKQYCVPDIYKTTGKDFLCATDLRMAGPFIRLVSSVPIVPGMSGGPLMHNNVVVGMATYFDRNFYESYFVGARPISWILDAFKAWDRGENSKTTIHLRNGLLYRKMRDGTLEIVPDMNRAGNANTADGGNANSSDGGNANSSDGGTGRVTNDPYTDFKIQSGILWKGKEPVHGFMTTWSSDVAIFANRGVFDWLLGAKSNSAEKIISTIPVGADLKALLLKRLDKYAMPNWKDGVDIKDIDLSQKEIRTTEFLFEPREPKIDAIISFPSKDITKLEIRVKGQAPLVLHFNKLGDLVQMNDRSMNQAFRPVINNASAFIRAIDFRDFYFANLESSQIMSQSEILRAPPSIRLVDAEGKVHNLCLNGGKIKEQLHEPDSQKRKLVTKKSQSPTLANPNISAKSSASESVLSKSIGT
jgi:hypothetical protein